MRIAARHPWRGLLASALLCAAGQRPGCHRHHFYVPFTLEQSSGTKAQNIWLADTANLGNPPFQLTNQVLDGPYRQRQNVAILDDWTSEHHHPHQATTWNRSWWYTAAADTSTRRTSRPSGRCNSSATRAMASSAA